MKDNFKIQISVVVPVFNEEESIEKLYPWIKNVLDTHHFTYEIIFIDDGSTDQSWSQIESFCNENNKVKGIRCNKNYGKSAALHLGFQEATGEVVITLDADLQDSPNEIPELYKMIVEQKYELVSGWKKNRKDPLEKKIPSKFFNFVTRKVSGIYLHDFNCGLKAYKNEVVKNIQVFGEKHRYIPLLAKWQGYTKIGEKIVEHRKREYGVTKFGFDRYIKGFLDLLSLSFTHKFRNNPMHLFGTMGILSFTLGFIITFYIIYEKIYNNLNNLPVRDAVDQPLFFLALVALIIGVQLFMTGFLAEIFLQSDTNRTKKYVIASKKNI